jgi:hypothetical protein
MRIIVTGGNSGVGRAGDGLSVSHVAEKVGTALPGVTPATGDDL